MSQPRIHFDSIGGGIQIIMNVDSLSDRDSINLLRYLMYKFAPKAGVEYEEAVVIIMSQANKWCYYSSPRRALERALKEVHWHLGSIEVVNAESGRWLGTYSQKVDGTIHFNQKPVKED